MVLSILTALITGVVSFGVGSFFSGVLDGAWVLVIKFVFIIVNGSRGLLALNLSRRFCWILRRLQILWLQMMTRGMLCYYRNISWSPMFSRSSKINLPFHALPDSIIWHFDRHGDFSVKSGYHLAVQLRESCDAGSSEGVASQPWHNVLNLKVPTNVTIFLWRALCDVWCSLLYA